MVYADFPYYQDFYCGTSITDAATFRTAAARASEYIDSVTFGQITADVFKQFDSKIKNCCCALADFYELQRQIYISGSDNGTKKSETQNHYSVTYSTPEETLSTLLSGKTIDEYLYNVCMRYLGCTGLLYRGCD